MAIDFNYEIPIDVMEAVTAARKWAMENLNDDLAPYAVTYMDAINQSIDEAIQIGFTPEKGLKIQLLYVLSNLENWRGKEKAVLEKFIK